MRNYDYVEPKGNFDWEYTEQPHMRRRAAILKKHPEIRRFMKANGDWQQVWWSALFAILHVLIAYGCCFVNLPWRVFPMVAVGTWFSSWFFLTAHEAAHGLVFGPAHPWRNSVYGLLVNLLHGLPTYTFFKKHHKDHHKFLGVDAVDIENPTQLEVYLFNRNAILRYLWILINALLQHIRAAFIGPSNRATWEAVVNHISVWSLDFIIIYFGYRPMVAYFMASYALASGANFITLWGLDVHTTFWAKEETRSYYGWMNKVFLNFGYHVEHHDFPNIPGRFLPEVHRIASEFYEQTHRLDSIYTPMFKFLFGECRVGVHSRLKRRPTKKIVSYGDRHRS